MPIVPYEPQARPRLSNVPSVPNIQPEYDPLPDAIAKASKSVQEAFIRLDTQKAEMEAQGAFAAFGDRTRQHYMKLQERKGYYAIGAVEQHDKVLGKDIEDISKGLSSNRAQQLFKSYAMQRRDSVLNKIANYESQQTQIAKQATVESTISEVIRAIDIGIDPEMFDLELKRVESSISILYAGTSLGVAKKANTKKKLVTTYLMDKAVKEPQNINDLVKRYSDYINNSDIKRIKDAAKNFDIDAQVEAATTIIDFQESDPEKQLELAMKFVKGKKLKPEVEQKLINRYKNKWATDIALKEKQDIRVQKKMDKEAITLWRDSNFEVLDEYARGMPDPDKAKQWLRIVDEIRDGSRSPFRKSNEKLVGEVKEKIYKNPASVDVDRDIWMRMGKGLSADDAQILTVLRDKYLEKGSNPESGRCIDILQQLRKVKKFDEDPYENEKVFTEIRKDLFNWIESHPDKDPYTGFLQPIIYNKTTGWHVKAWDKLWQELVTKPTEFWGDYIDDMLKTDEEELSQKPAVRQKIKD